MIRPQACHLVWHGFTTIAARFRQTVRYNRGLVCSLRISFPFNYRLWESADLCKKLMTKLQTQLRMSFMYTVTVLTNTQSFYMSWEQLESSWWMIKLSHGGSLLWPCAVQTLTHTEQHLCSSPEGRDLSYRGQESTLQLLMDKQCNSKAVMMLHRN